MKRLIVLVGMCCLAVAANAAAQKQKYGVSVSAEKGVDFSKFKTYSWTSGQPSPIKEIDTHIVEAIDRELAALGMTKAAPGPGDVLVSYGSLSRTAVDLNAKAAPNETRPRYYVGTIVVVFSQPETLKRLLRLRVDQPTEATPEKIEESIDTALAALFAKYPTRTHK
jgi:Domain of unknown function (DUF4136)